jgi:multidrug efflux system outer membrane protein
MRRLAALAALLGLSACTVGPDYRRPAEPIPPAFKQAGPWKEATPQGTLDPERWWVVFGDPVLDELELRAANSSPRLHAALARLDQVRAALGAARATRYPQVEFVPDVGRFGVSGNRPDQPSKVPTNTDYEVNRFRVPLYASYEVDIWGRVRRLVEAADARSEASLASYRTVMLSLQGEIAQAWFQLCAADQELAILRQNIELRQKARDLVETRKRGGIASELDVARIQTELATAESDAYLVARRRAELEYALAVLVGETPESFSLPERRLEAQPPAVPVGLPADLLERRPDIAEAERLLVARNAEIGVAKAAFFPAIRLTGGVGFESSELSDLFQPESTIWSLFGSLTQPVFDGGRNRANLARAEAAYRENLAEYRQRLLAAFQEVESALAGLRLLSEQAGVQARAQSSAETAARLASARYRAGLVVVLEVIDAQRVKLAVERQTLQVRTQQLATTIALIKALGGGWTGSAPAAASAARPPAPDA